MITPIRTLEVIDLFARKNDLLVSVADIKELARNERAKAIDEKVLDIQYYKKASTTVIERCDAQLNLIEELKKEVNTLAEQLKEGGKE